MRCGRELRSPAHSVLLVSAHWAQTVSVAGIAVLVTYYLIITGNVVAA
ncbi:MAG: hypothetical protein WBM03_13210 [Steroidobacteraceae bacterium]